jgi:hypothetical protein
VRVELNAYRPTSRIRESQRSQSDRAIASVGAKPAKHGAMFPARVFCLARGPGSLPAPLLAGRSQAALKNPAIVRALWEARWQTLAAQ